MAKKPNRQAELARIHIAKKDLGMNDDEYRTMLHVVTGKSSAGDLTARQRYQVLDHMKSLAEGPKKSYPGRPNNMDGNSSRVRQLEKIEALLTIGRKPWAYGDAMAKRICKVDKLTWVEDADLYKIITALRKQAKKEGWDLNE
ncbi:regulatory protein GemA [uncultured Desulfuromusa sp.]|uniref:gp16 family protein n=1 Tax=uncultured Desulfuromusa sp. TaxID=219183 RepID=UPI002AA80CF6|nr:regulatory protein GemA [uncultured Desulfuromusa sp.]